MNKSERVICIDNSVEPRFLQDRLRLFQHWIIKDKIYTVRELVNNDDIVDGLLLEEVRNRAVYQPLLNRYQESAFKPSRFRKLTPDEVYMLDLEEDFEEVDEFVKILDE